MTKALCQQCGSALQSGACPKCASPSRTMVLQAQAGPSRAVPLPAGDDLARIPLPDGWEITIDIVGGPDRGGSHRITRSRVLICRGGGDVSLTDPRCSRTHASVEVYGSTCVLVKDLGSTNGTYLNDRRITSAELNDGDTIRVGDTQLVISIGVPPT
jgi:hypothetical protein